MPSPSAREQKKIINYILKYVVTKDSKRDSDIRDT